MEGFWQLCLGRFQQELPHQQFNTWIKPLRVENDGDAFRIIAPNRFVMQWIKDRFLGRIEVMGEEYFSRPVSLVLSMDATTKGSPLPATQALSPAAPSGQKSPGTLPSPLATSAPISPTSIRPATLEAHRLNPNFTFANFVNGKANQLARAAALQVSERPGSGYNPLFVYGGVGLGKTHLVQAIGNQVLEHNPQAKIRYIHAEQYVSDVVRAYQHKSFDTFKRYYHSLDLLIIDDIQFFGGKTRTQEEFFYAFNALVDAHKQVIITCDSYPKEIADMDERLISRFGWGLTVAVEPPELEMRVAILLKKAAADNIVLDDQVAFFIAKHIRSNVRELEGALKRVLAYSRFTGETVTVILAKEALRDLLAVQNRQVSVDNIQKTVADYFKIKVSDMFSKKRVRSIARPRQVAMALAKELTHLSLPDIGEAFGNRDHTTVLHACRKIQELRASDPDMNRDVTTLLQTLKG
ncbi:MAG: chromosomal replication initiator protein DnaA [Burkholderiales bacterium]